MKKFGEDIYSLKNGRKRKVAAYCRVSTNFYDQKNSLENQKTFFEKYIKEEKNWEYVGIYFDEGISGTLLKERKDFMRLIEDAKNKKIDLIVIKNISRFSRYTKDALNILDELRDAGVGIWFEENHMYTLDRTNELVLTMMLTVSQQQVLDTSDHVTAALKMKASKGEIVNFRGCYGYRWDSKTKRPEVIESEARYVRYIFKEYIKNGGGLKKISDKLNSKGIKTKRGVNKWSPATISGIIKNIKYIGDYDYGITYTTDPLKKIRKRNLGENEYIHHTNTHEAIIDRDTYELANEILNSKGKIQKNGHRIKVKKYPFSEITKCGICGSTCYHKFCNSSKDKYKKAYWGCTNRIKNGADKCRGSKNIRHEDIERAFIESFNHLKKNDGILIERLLENIKEDLKSNDNANNIDSIKIRLENNKAKLNKLIDLKVEDKISDEMYEAKYSEINYEIESCQDAIDDMSNMFFARKELFDRIEIFREQLNSQKELTKFDAKLFENTVDQVIIGTVDKDGKPLPYVISFIYKFVDGNSIEIRRRKNNLCSFNKYQTLSINDLARFKSL